MLKRFGFAGLLLATLAVTPLTVAARDRSVGVEAGNRHVTWTEPRYNTDRRSNAENNRRDVRRNERVRYERRDSDGDRYRTDSHLNRYDYR